MIYYPRDDTWYCIECHENGKIWDPKDLGCADCGDDFRFCPHCGEDYYCPACILDYRIEIQRLVDRGIPIDQDDHRILKDRYYCRVCGKHF